MVRAARNSVWLVLFGAFLASSGVAEAALVTPVNAWSTSYWAVSPYACSPNNLVNSSGLSANTPTGTHDNHSFANTMWIAGHLDGGLGGPTGTIGNPPSVASQAVVFDLGSTYNLTGTYVWNQNQNHPTAPPVGEFYDVAGGTPAEPAQWVPFGGSGVRLVKFDIQSAQSGLANEYVGLSEVRFDGVPTSAGPPRESLLSVDFGHSSTLAPAPTQTGFSPFLETDSPSKTFGAYTVSVSGHEVQTFGGFLTRSALSDSGAFTNAALYDDFIFTNGGGPISFVIDGLAANTPYELTWYVYDRFSDGGGGIYTSQITPTPGSNTTGDTVLAVFNSTAAPTANDQYAFTGTWSSSDTSLEIDISYVSRFGANFAVVRANGFEVFEVGQVIAVIPEPSTFAIWSLGLLGLGFCGRRRRPRC